MGYVSNPGGASGGGNGDHLIPLDADSVLYTDAPSAFPYGISTMLAEDTDTPGAFGYEWVVGIVQTSVHRDPTDTYDRATQWLIGRGVPTPRIESRQWDPIAEEWSEFEAFALQSFVFSALGNYYTKAQIDAMLA